MSLKERRKKERERQTTIEEFCLSLFAHNLTDILMEVTHSHLRRYTHISELFRDLD